MKRIFNRSTEAEKRRLLRENATESEKIVWQKLRDRRFKGFKFKRQYSIGPYIVDFYCSEAKLALEIDGAVHRTADAIEYDKVRDDFIKSLGIKVIRFSNDEIENNINEVFNSIAKVIVNN